MFYFVFVQCVWPCMICLWSCAMYNSPISTRHKFSTLLKLVNLSPESIWGFWAYWFVLRADRAYRDTWRAATALSRRSTPDGTTNSATPVRGGTKRGILVCQHICTLLDGIPQDAKPMPTWCWASVYDAGPTSGRHWLIVSYLLGRKWC